MPSFKPVIALLGGLEILLVVNEERESSVRCLHRATGLDKGQSYALLETLEHQGYLLHEADRALYVPIALTLRLSQGYDQHLWIGGLAEPVLRAFRQEVSGPSHFSAFDRDTMVVAQTTREPDVISFMRRARFRFAVLMTSIGRAYLPFAAPQRYRIIATLAVVLIAETLGARRACAPRAPGFRRHRSDDASQCSDVKNGREAVPQAAAQGGSRPGPEI
jgi:IclR family transcriptional regulator, mhp operon transcriptional activator